MFVNLKRIYVFQTNILSCVRKMNSEQNINNYNLNIY